jgi:hypothetical protein
MTAKTLAHSIASSCFPTATASRRPVCGTGAQADAHASVDSVTRTRVQETIEHEKATVAQFGSTHRPGWLMTNGTLRLGKIGNERGGSFPILLPLSELRTSFDPQRDNGPSWIRGRHYKSK